MCIIQVLFFLPSVSAVVVLSVFDAVVRFRHNKRQQQPGKETDKNYKTAQQDAEKRKEHADKGLDRKFKEDYEEYKQRKTRAP